MTGHRSARKVPASSGRQVVVAVLLAALVGLYAGCGSGGVTVVSWGGSYAEACKKAFFDPFSAETGIEVRVESFNGGLAQVRAQVETGNVHWDVVDLEFADVVRDATKACSKSSTSTSSRRLRTALPHAMTISRAPIPNAAGAGSITRVSTHTIARAFPARGRPPSRTSSISASSRVVAECVGHPLSISKLP